MELLADENIETEWIQALRDDGHDVVRVIDINDLGMSATDPDVLAVATREVRVLLTADQSDFSNPPTRMTTSLPYLPQAETDPRVSMNHRMTQYSTRSMTNLANDHIWARNDRLGI